MSDESEKSYETDVRWQRVEHNEYDEDEGCMVSEAATCSECENGRIWSDGTDKVCDNCGYTSNRQTMSRRTDRYPIQKRPRYWNSREIVLEGAMGHDEVDLGELYWPD